MENSHRFFENKACQYYPCHTELEHFNCLFCYCPLYSMDKCPGTPVYIDVKGRKVRDCSACVYPHLPENYEAIIHILGSDANKLPT